MSTPSTVDGPSMDEQEEMDAEEHLDSSSSHVHDSSKEGELDDQSSTKPKRNRKSTQRFLDSIVDDEPLAFVHKQKKKNKPAKKMDGSSSEATHNESSQNESGGDLHSEGPSESHEQAADDAEKERKPRVIPGSKAHVQCAFMESKKKEKNQCKQRAIDGFLFCIWHILNDQAAPYMRCAFMRDKEKNGMMTKVQCKTNIKENSDPPLCLAHSEKPKKPKKKRDSIRSIPDSSVPSTSTSKGESSDSPQVTRTSVGPISPSSSSHFNVREFEQDIDQAIGNMEMGHFENFDDFESILDEEEVKEEEDTVEEGDMVDGHRPLPFEVDDELTPIDRDNFDDLIVPIYNVGNKIIERLTAMRNKYEAGGSEFWQACHVNPDAPTTIEQYRQRYVSERRFDNMQISEERREELRNHLSNPAVSEEFDLTHKFNMDLLREQLIIQRCMLNNEPAPAPVPRQRLM